MRACDLKRCRAAPLFEALRTETLQHIVADARVNLLSEGDIIFREGEKADFLFALFDGQVGLLGARNEQETVLALANPNATFILATVVLHTAALMSARALAPSEVLAIPGEAIREAMQQDVQFAAAVSRDLAREFRTMVRGIKDQKLRSGVERLANHLLTLCESDKNAVAGQVLLRHEKRVLASLLGMTPENLSRAFAALRDYGVTVNGPLVTLDDLDALCALARPDFLIEARNPPPSNDRSGVKSVL